MVMDNPECVLCHQPLTSGHSIVTLTPKGCDGIQRASEARGLDIQAVPGQQIHAECRKKFCNKRYIDAYNRKRASESPDTNKTLRSSEMPFDIRKNCIFCGTADIYEGKKRDFKLIPVRTFDFQNAITDACAERNDQWAQRVKARLECVHDLHAADAVYHQTCSINFRTGKQIPQKYVPSDGNTTKRMKFGRPQDKDQHSAFLKVLEFLKENDEEQITIGDLIHKMTEYLSDTDHEAYGFTYMKQQIKKRFGDKVVITEINGKPNVVTFRSTAAAILQEFHSHSKNESQDDEKLRIIKTAANFIKNDIKSLEQQKEMYPTYSDICSVESVLAFLPESLKLFLQGLFTSRNADLRLGSIGQAIIQATRPRVILAPLQLGLGIQLHHHFASKFLIDSLNQHGFCCSYSEVTKFERSAAVIQGTDIPNFAEGSFIQYVADNVDHNIRTIDGNNTFHGMGMIAVVTPGTTNRRAIPRAKVTAEDIAIIGQVNIEHFRPEVDGMRFVNYEHLSQHDVENPTSKVDMLWEMSLSLQSHRPSWGGMMQMVHKGSHPGKSSVFFLPMIDLNPGDMSCVYSTLLYLSSHARRHGVTPIVTFDQPLWLKAVTIQNSVSADSEIRSIVLRLGGFHTEMSFLGSIGHIMAGAGLQEVLEVVYASNAVSHMLNGKAISRAIRGHLLVAGALNAILLSKAFGTPLLSIASTDCPQETGENTETAETSGLPSVQGYSQESVCPEDEECMVPRPEVLSAVNTIFDDLMEGKTSVESLETSSVLEEVQQKLQQEKDVLQNKRTSKLWLQYLQMVAILLMFIKAERTGNWKLHLKAVHDMLPYLAASGHNNYTKSLYLYLKDMDRLEQVHPEVYQHFLNGLHVVRRTDRFWAGLSPDLIIEQVLMRSIKTTGGLTRGRGMMETQRLVWLLSTTACSEMNLALQELTSVAYQTSEQHKDQSKARQKKDAADKSDLLAFIASRSPFDDNPCLRNINNGMTASASVNADCAREVGDKILQDMVDKPVLTYSFKKKDQVTNMASSDAIKVREEEVVIDPQLLFQRLVTAGVRNENLQDIFEYELCSFPPSLFENKTTPRLAHKASLADALWKLMPPAMSMPTEDIQYVLDGGALLHRIPWSRGSTYDDICQQYSRYVIHHYGQPTVVFDGYVHGPSTKDMTQRRRAGSYRGATVHFTSSMVFTGKKEDFLSNKENKQRFISLLSHHLEHQGCHIEHARGDADLLVVQTAIAVAEGTAKPTFLVGEDTDLLVLLCFHATCTNIYLRPEPRFGSKKASRCWDIAKLRHILGADVYENVLFMHAVLGCDTTSAIYGLGKAAALKLMINNHLFQQQARVFGNPGSQRHTIIYAGEKSLVILCNGKPEDDLNVLRLHRFHQRVGKSTSCVHPQVLPPTSAAAKFHSLRVYLQVQQWMGHGGHLKPEDWGWYIQDGKYFPVLTDKDAAPVELLDVVKCNCKMGCGTRQCTCRKHGLDCTSACGHCRGVCSNVANLEEDETDDE